LVIVLKTAGWIVGATAAYSQIGAQLNGFFGPYTANILLGAIKLSQQAQGLVATVVSVVTLLIGATTAQRVVQGAQHLSPALGDRMMATKLLGRSVVLRELMPQDLKLAIDQLTRDEAVSSARYLAEVVGKAHARQMDSVTRKAFGSTFTVHRSAQLDAPSWLWSSVVELASMHEAAYLEHCRRYALGEEI
jgi:uncharacterized protein (DUF2252 family)